MCFRKGGPMTPRARARINAAAPYRVSKLRWRLHQRMLHQVYGKKQRSARRVKSIELNNNSIRRDGSNMQRKIIPSHSFCVLFARPTILSMQAYLREIEGEREWETRWWPFGKERWMVVGKVHDLCAHRGRQTVANVVQCLQHNVCSAE